MLGVSLALHNEVLSETNDFSFRKIQDSFCAGVVKRAKAGVGRGILRKSFEMSVNEFQNVFDHGEHAGRRDSVVYKWWYACIAETPDIASRPVQCGQKSGLTNSCEGIGESIHRKNFDLVQTADSSNLCFQTDLLPASSTGGFRSRGQL